MNYKIILSVFILTLFTIAACSEIEDEITVSETLGVHGKGAKDKESDNFHGYFLTQISNGTLDNCKECHGSDFKGGITEQKCTGCHKPIAVHQDGIKNPSSPNFHATYMVANQNTMQQCSQCHGDNYKGGVSSPSCANCHNSIPVHVDGIMEPGSGDFHGKYFAVNGIGFSECNTCHGDNFEGGVLAPECATCHPSIDIHKDGISDKDSPNFHAKYIESNETDLAQCADCHGEDFNGGMSAPSCNSCHSSIDVHKPGMLDPNSPDFHGKYIADNEIQLNSCATCHGSDFTGGNTAPGCTTCHSSIGVHQDGIMNGSSPNFHGKYLGVNNVGFNSCTTCHGDNFEGGLAAPNCITCHNSITVHKGGIMNPGSEDFHPLFLKNQNISMSECASCHGSDFNGGDSSPRCTTCHSTIGVHQDGMQDHNSDKFHGKYLGVNNVKFTSCQTCHGENFEGGIVAPTCKACHSTIDVHKDGITNPSSPNYHVNYMSENDVKLNQCATCHGEDFSGGSSSPTCAECHSSIGVHQSGIMVPGSDKFHGKYLGINEMEMSVCQTCHGDNFEGGVLANTCTTCHSTITIHKEGIMTPTSDEFHGNAIGVNDFKLTQCASCHGESFEGGSSSPECITCHTSVDVHKAGIIDGSSNDFHGVFLGSNTWDVDQCASCHQSDFAGSATSPTCNSCHNDYNGPVSCNTCHGSFTDPSIVAPPNGLRNKSDRNQYTGAHMLHLSETSIAETVKCQQCHIVPSSYDKEGHIDDGTRSEIVFGSFADPNSSASYDFNNTTCENTYCHGNFEFLKSESSYPEFYPTGKIEGNKFDPNWLTLDGSQAKCGTCHGEIDANGELVTPLPKGHKDNWTLTQCASCHWSVVDNTGNIIDPKKHINGKANVFDN